MSVGVIANLTFDISMNVLINLTVDIGLIVVVEVSCLSSQLTSA
jgi:hypothetical protein